MLSLSELTLLLPHHQGSNRVGNDDGVGSTQSRGRAFMTVAAAVSLVIIVAGNHRHVTVEKDVANVESVDATMDMWDMWKSRDQRFQEKPCWRGTLKLNDNDTPEKSASLWGETNAVTRGRSWWDVRNVESEDFVIGAVQNAEQFGDHIAKWWKTVDDDEGLMISGFSVGEKEAALQHSFQTWWDGATHAERAWWNSTVKQLQHEKSVGTSWMNSVKQETAGMVQRSRDGIGATERTIRDDETAVLEKGLSDWNETRQHLHDREQDAASKFDLWWLITKTIAQRGLNTTTETEDEWWKTTESWLRNHVIGGSHEFESSMTRPLVYLNSTISYTLLMNGYQWMDYSADFFLFQSGWNVQINQAYCALASVAAVLNSLRWQIELPIDPNYDPHPYATQLSLLEISCVRETVVYHNATFDGVLYPPGGLNLGQVKRLLECALNKDWNVAVRYVDPEIVTVDNVRQDLKEALMNSSQRVFVNYDRHEVGQDGGGHFSPLGSYSKQYDSFLIMDVAKYKYPPVWVPTERLFAAMATQDSCGDWDYPFAQDKLNNGRHFTSLEEYGRAMKRLGCSVKYRGYIVVG